MYLIPRVLQRCEQFARLGVTFDSQLRLLIARRFHLRQLLAEALQLLDLLALLLHTGLQAGRKPSVVCAQLGRLLGCGFGLSGLQLLLFQELCPALLATEDVGLAFSEL